MEKRLMAIWIIDCPSVCQYEEILKKPKKVKEDLVKIFRELLKLGQYLIDKMKCCPLIKLCFV